MIFLLKLIRKKLNSILRKILAVVFFHKTYGKVYAPLYNIEPVEISDFVLLGCNTVVLPGVTIPEGMATGDLSLVSKKNYDSWSLYVGIPCKFLCKCDSVTIKLDAKKMLNLKNNEKS